MIGWIGENWFQELQTLSLVVGLFSVAGGLVLNGLAKRAQTRERKIQNIYIRNAAHRDIHCLVLKHPELARVYDENLPGDTVPTLRERIFVRELILNCAADFKARKYGMADAETGLPEDVRQFFSKPIAQAVWKDLKKYQEVEFVAYIETSLGQRAK